MSGRDHVNKAIWTEDNISDPLVKFVRFCRTRERKEDLKRGIDPVDGVKIDLTDGDILGALVVVRVLAKEPRALGAGMMAILLGCSHDHAKHVLKRLTEAGIIETVRRRKGESAIRALTKPARKYAERLAIVDKSSRRVQLNTGSGKHFKGARSVQARTGTRVQARTLLLKESHAERLTLPHDENLPPMTFPEGDNNG